MKTYLPAMLAFSVCFALGTTAGAQVQSPATGLVSYWNFDDSTADQAWLYSANSGVAEDNFKSIGGPARYAPGKVGRALVVDVSHLAARFSADVTLPAGYTIEAWIRPTKITASWQRFLLHWGGEKGYHFALQGETVSLYHKQTDGLEPHPEGGKVVAGRWQHIAATADAEAKLLTVYLDGQPTASEPYDGTIAETHREGLGLGDSAGGPGGGNHFTGLVDELAVWNVVLSPEQIASHFQHPGQRLGLVARTYRQVVLEAEPEGYWPLGETDGTTVDDASGNGHTGTVRSGAQLGQPGVPTIASSRAVALDGSSGHVNLGDVDACDGLEAITVEAWVRWKGAENHRGVAVFLRKEGVFAFGTGWIGTNGASQTVRNARFWVHSDARSWQHSANGITRIDDGRWHHVAGVYDGKFARIYVDGIEESSQEIGPVTLSATANPLCIGSSGGGEFFPGLITEAMLHTRALSAKEIYEHYVFGVDSP